MSVCTLGVASGGVGFSATENIMRSNFTKVLNSSYLRYIDTNHIIHLIKKIVRFISYISCYNIYRIHVGCVCVLKHETRFTKCNGKSRWTGKILSNRNRVWTTDVSDRWERMGSASVNLVYIIALLKANQKSGPFFYFIFYIFLH